MSLYQRVLGHPLIYDRIRPLVVGRIDWAPFYRNLDAGMGDVILDVGCGTGIAHQYLKGFGAYYGFDSDPVAIRTAESRTAAPNVRYECRIVTPEDFARIRPTRVILSGLLHHLSDADCLALLEMCRGTASVRRVATADPVYLPGQLVSNVLAYFDRGKFVRQRESYLDLARRAGLRIVREEVVRTHAETGRARLILMTLEPPV